VKLLIVDDEAPARARLHRLLQAHADVQVVGEAADGAGALQQVAALGPDALLLDIQMPGIGGLDVAASLPDPAPALIFVSAFDRYALPAFDAAALDYLLKPVEPERLARALQRLRDRRGGVAVSRRPTPTRLLIPDRGRTLVVAVAEILWLEAADNYVVVHTAERAPLMRRTLSALLDDLGDGFMRCHRGAAVALSAVASMQPRDRDGRGDRGDGVLLLHGGQQVPCSRSLRPALLARLSARFGPG
jgi:two-component system LytT family response regulator